MNKEKINTALKYWHNRLSNLYNEDHILNITLYGSQNYGIDTENSDIDVKAIYVPSLWNAITKEKWLSKELINDNNEHCEIKDIREMCKMYKKQNLNFLETLFTEYRWDNPKYANIHYTFQARAEDIAHYDEQCGIKSICGQALNTIKQLRKAQFDLKKFSKVIYLYLYLNKYKDNKEEYRNVLQVKDSEKFQNLPARKLLIDLKANNLNYLIDFLNDQSSTLDYLEQFFINESKNTKPSEDITNVEYFLNKTCLDAINQYEAIINGGLHNQ